MPGDPAQAQLGPLQARHDQNFDRHAVAGQALGQAAQLVVATPGLCPGAAQAQARTGDALAAGVQVQLLVPGVERALGQGLPIASGGGQGVDGCGLALGDLQRVEVGHWGLLLVDDGVVRGVGPEHALPGPTQRST